MYSEIRKYIGEEKRIAAVDSIRSFPKKFFVLRFSFEIS